MKQRLLSFAAVTAALAAVPVPAAAVPSTAAAYEAGRCLVTHDRRAAIALLARLPLGEGEAELDGVEAGCARTLAGASPLLIRGAIAQALFLRDFRGFGQAPRDEWAIVNLNLPVEGASAADRTAQLYAWGDCVARNDAASVDRLLRAPVGSPDERAALAGLQAYMANCMPAGQQLSVRPWEVRSLFAQAAYHMLYRYWTGQLQTARR